MKLISYISAGARLKPVVSFSRLSPSLYEGEILREVGYQPLHASIIRYRKIGDTNWSYRAYEVNGSYVWYYDITPDDNGSVISQSDLYAHCGLPGFSHGPAYEYMIEGISPLLVDSPDWMITPFGDECDDLRHYRRV